MRSVARAVARATVFCVSGASLLGQQIDLGGAGRPTSPQHVSLLTDSADIKAGVSQTVELRFKVDAGYHINSHTPKDELLIPTVVRLAAPGVRVEDEMYPTGKALRLEIGSGETLDVYQEEFRVALRLVAPRGSSTLTGSLKYQACDRAACFPPKTLPLAVALTAK